MTSAGFRPEAGPVAAAVTGASGFVGRHLVQRLARGGTAVRALSRQPSALPPGATGRTVHDYADEEELARAFAGVDTVFHVAGRAHVAAADTAEEAARFHAAHVPPARAVAAAARRTGVRRVVLVSSIGVLGAATQGRPFTAEDTPHPAEPYAVSKLAAEDALVEALADGPTAWTIVRPPLVYGPRCPGNFARLVSLVQRLPWVPLASLDRPRSLIGVDNLADALAVAAVHEGARGRRFVVCDGEDVTVGALVRWIAEGLGPGAGRPVRFPPSGLQALAVAAGRRAAWDKLAAALQVDGSAFTRATGWRAPRPVADGVRDAARSFNHEPAAA